MRSEHLIFSFIAIALGACHTEEATPDPQAHGENAVAVASGSSTTSTPQPAKYGDAITIANETPISAIVSSPSSFQGKAIETEGTVKAVCQERGCWMTLTDDANKTAMVRMHGHSFFVPKNASGKNARVQGTVLLVRDEKECDESKGEKAEIELDATGVELL